MLAVDEFGEDQFTAMIGAEAIYEMLAAMNSKRSRAICAQTWRIPRPS